MQLHAEWRVIEGVRYRRVTLTFTNVANACFSKPRGFIPADGWPDARRYDDQTWMGSWEGWLPDPEDQPTGKAESSPL